MKDLPAAARLSAALVVTIGVALALVFLSGTRVEFPAAIALLLGLASLTAAAIYLTSRASKVYRERIEVEQRRAGDMAALHLATIEALARAIDAKDQMSRDHVRRIQHYAAGLARAAGLSAEHVQGIMTAALLHDIGKLAVPEHILSKPGPLTAEEFEKVRAHPQVGAEIIDGIPFPYPVAPLIRSHHERWDGRGYPAGLKGEAIPIGARILAVVDFYDALTSERPYHRPISHEAALGLLRQEAGAGLDPNLVETFLQILPALNSELEAAAGMGAHKASTAPPTHDTMGRWPSQPVQNDVFADIARAHREIYALYDMAQALGTSLGVSDTMSLIAAKLTGLVPYSCCALFLYDPEREVLRCRFATGIDADVIQRIVVRLGEGLNGWVARNRQPLQNARPRVDLEVAGLPAAATRLESALVSPLVFTGRLIGTIAVYHVTPGHYTDDHRRLLDQVSEQAAAVIKNSIVFEQTQEESLTDPLTGLPNTRSLVMHLTRELARAERLKSHLSLLVMDIDDFKAINDTHGHHIGDRALCKVATVLRDAIRPYDICVRYAGDEFILVLSGCGRDEGERKRQELQRAISAILFDIRPGRRLPLSISAGLAVYPDDGSAYEALLAAADGRMYEDKAARKRAQAAHESNRMQGGSADAPTGGASSGWR